MTASFIVINRHRLATDGKGVTTLVAFSGCPLRCKYCLNDQCHDPERIATTLSPQQLLDQVMVDNLYFLATGGGICFGGGEPLLHSEFIHQFCTMKVAEWRISLETSLNVPQHLVKGIGNNQVELTGKVIAQFLVDTEGKIDSIKIVKTLNMEADSCVINAIKSLPHRFKPAVYNGKLVKMRYTLPIYFEPQKQ